MHSTQHSRTSRHDSGVAFTSSPACLFASTSTLPDPFSDSDSSSPRSLSSTYSSSLPSSLASSPALKPTRWTTGVDDELLLSGSDAGSDKPTPTQLAAYASSIIRNEAYALLALAARIAPVAHPIVDLDDDQAVGSADSPEMLDGVESRSNIGFRQVIEALSNLPPHGKILVTGVGKSGLAAKKTVATLCSLVSTHFELTHATHLPRPIVPVETCGSKSLHKQHELTLFCVTSQTGHSSTVPAPRRGAPRRPRSHLPLLPFLALRRSPPHLPLWCHRRTHATTAHRSISSSSNSRHHSRSRFGSRKSLHWLVGRWNWSVCWTDKGRWGEGDGRSRFGVTCSYE